MVGYLQDPLRAGVRMMVLWVNVEDVRQQKEWMGSVHAQTIKSQEVQMTAENQIT
jgi:hypothetical protein